jgi:putative transposase
MLRDLLNRERTEIGRRPVATLMKRMGIEALYCKPSTSKPAPGHKIYPYLLRGVTVDRPNQVWAMDITYIPMARGFVYLAAVVDWFSRRVLSWRVSITLEAAFCIEALEDALARHGRPEIFNTDQGSQFTSSGFTDVLVKNGIAISMDGRGSWRDNVFVERLWRSIKYEEVYLRAYDTVSQARACLGRYLAFYNGRRPHSSLDRQTPDQAAAIRCSLKPQGSTYPGASCCSDKLSHLSSPLSSRRTALSLRWRLMRPHAPATTQPRSLFDDLCHVHLLAGSPANEVSHSTVVRGSISILRG